ncbi:MAG TPA: hypothetical protein V6C72_14790, partial [Chroococcales cyanobacterium]
VAFPLAIARQKDGRFAGFVMKRVTGHKPLFELYSPGARKRHFPRADFRFLVRTAANVARAVASVHKANCVIGDINHSGILVSDEAKVALIDADSFQIIDGSNRYLCRVGVPEYTPPELQGKKLSTIVRTANHDAFGLAVVIFQLLFMGRHPFVGAFAKGDMPMERAIFENRFVYSVTRDVGMTRPPGAAALTDFPSYVADAFEQAFKPNADRRPGAEEWIEILVRLESEVVRCSADDLHYYPQAAPECPWCRMEKKLGILLFLPFLKRSAAYFDPGAASFNLTRAWEAIEQVVLPKPSQLQATLPQVGKYVPSKEAKRAKAEVWKSKGIGIAIFLLAAVVAFNFPKFWFAWSPLFVLAAVKFFYIKIKSESFFVEKYWHSKSRVEDAIEEWRTRCGITQALAVKSSLAQARQELQKIEREKQLRLNTYQGKRQGIQLIKYLESKEIRKAKIRQVGLARQTALASYGIENALDITEEKILQVPGFGANNSKPLLEWRKSVEKAFVYDPKSNEMDIEEVQKINFELDQKGSEFRKILTSGPSDLANAVQSIISREKKEDPVVAHAYAEFQRDKGDLIYLGIPIPKKAGHLKGGNPAASFSAYSNAFTTGGATPAVQSTPAPAPRTSVGSTARSHASSQSRSANGAKSQTAAPAQSRTAPTQISCPQCGQSMITRVFSKGARIGQTYCVCSDYPDCNGVVFPGN